MIKVILLRHYCKEGSQTAQVDYHTLSDAWKVNNNTVRFCPFCGQDLKEELDARYNRNIEFHLKNFDVVAINVTKLRTDNYDPKEYMTRIENWNARVVSGGGSWKVTNDMDQLEKIFN